MVQLNVGIVGFGMSAQVFHIPFINTNPNYKLAKILERTTDKAKSLYPDINIIKTIDELLDDKEIDLVVITTPNLTHYEFTKSALLAGKHVVVEKPFTVTSTEANELIELATKQNLILSVYHNRRFDGDFLTVKQIINNKLLGQIVEYEAHFDRFRDFIKDNWREVNQPGSGILYDLASHLIDQALSLFGLPESIRADIRIQREKSETDDNFEVILNYKNLKVILKAGMLVREPGPHFTLHGTKGSFVKYGLDPQEELLKNGNKPVGNDWGKEKPKHWGILNTDINGLHFKGKIETTQSSYARFYENVYEAIINQTELIIKPEQARDVIRIIEMAIESNQQKTTINL